MAKIPTDLWLAYTRILFVESTYWCVSIGMVFVNEFVLSNGDLTIFITIFQIIFSLSILITLDYITKAYLNPEDATGDGTASKLITADGSHEDPSKLARHQMHLEGHRPSELSESLIHLLYVNIPRRLNIETCKVVFPLSILYIGMLLLNNFCLEYVGVAFYFVSRSLTTVFNVIFTYFIINEPVSRGALICCAFIVLGFILGIDQESVIGSLSVIGVIFGVASSLFTSLFSIYTKKTLAKLDKNIWQLVLYNNINAIMLCTPLLVVHGDLRALISDKVISTSFWSMLSISGVMAFLISIVTNASIKYTSPLTHNISGTAKACLQTVIAVIYRHDNKSHLWWLSNITILVASAAYSRIKQLEMERKSSISLSNVYVTDDNQRSTPQKSNSQRRRDSTSSDDMILYSKVPTFDASMTTSESFKV